MTKSQTMSLDSKKLGSSFMAQSKEAVESTTYIETDSSSFRELVQKLTGVSEGDNTSENPSKGIEMGCGLMKNGIEMGPRKQAFKLHQRRQFHKKVHIKLGLRTHPDSDSYSFLPNLISSPITPLGHADLFTHSAHSCTSSNPNSYSKSSYLEEEGHEFCLETSANCLKSEPQLLPLFPLHSTTRPNST